MTNRHADLLAADVYQVGHHNSVTSTSAFLEAVNPADAVYSAGPGNQYGHPQPEAIGRLVDAGVAVYGTDVHGTVIVTTDGTDLAVATTRDEPPITSAAAPRAPPRPRARGRGRVRRRAGTCRP